MCQNLSGCGRRKINEGRLIQINYPCFCIRLWLKFVRKSELPTQGIGVGGGGQYSNKILGHYYYAVLQIIIINLYHKMCSHRSCGAQPISTKIVTFPNSSPFTLGSSGTSEVKYLVQGTTCWPN